MGPGFRRDDGLSIDDSLEPRRVDREDQRVERQDQRHPALVMEVAGARLRHRPEAAGRIEGDALDAGRHGVFALDLAGRRIDPVERAPMQVAARDP